MVRVAPDGYVQARQTITVSPSAGTAQLTLLSSVVSGVLATDQTGSPLSYSFSGGGTNLTVYTLGATSVSVLYTTDSLTNKSGTLWTIQFTSKYNCTVVLPEGATLSSISGTPASINVTAGSPTIDLAAGQWRMSYGVPLYVSTSSIVTSTEPGGGSPIAPPGDGGLYYAGAGIAAVALLSTAMYAFYWRRRVPGAGEGLRPDDIKVLEFIREKGGKAMEPEIRSKFALPKTSGWRQIKRLERLGYVRVSKVGPLNQVELTRGKTEP